MPRIYLPVSQLSNNVIRIPEEKAHYLTTVLRCQKGDDLVIFNGTGQCLHAVISEITRREVIVQVNEQYACDLEPPIKVHLMQGILKGRKMDLVIQKTTELGVREITPIIMERGTVRETGKIDRWRKIAEEASKQSGRSIIPAVHIPVSYRSIFSGKDMRVKGQGLIFYERGSLGLKETFSSLSRQPSDIFILIGPEGGFTREEITLAKEHGLFIVSLGKRILRAETAAITALALKQFTLGDMD